MNDPLTVWLHQVTQVPGIIVCGVRLPDRSTFTRSVAQEFPEEQMNRTWHRLSDTLQTLNVHRVQGQQMRWSYEHAEIHFAVRSDGATIGLVSLTGLAAPDPQIVSNLIDQFLSTH
jgi:hypothetical protein